MKKNGQAKKTKIIETKKNKRMWAVFKAISFDSLETADGRPLSLSMPGGPCSFIPVFSSKKAAILFAEGATVVEMESIQ